jgi:hypothetical protein
MIDRDAEASERERGVSLWLVALTPKMLEMAQRSPLGATLGRERLHFNPNCIQSPKFDTITPCPSGVFSSPRGFNQNPGKGEGDE